jgi:hypothetical protein
VSATRSLRCSEETHCRTCLFLEQVDADERNRLAPLGALAIGEQQREIVELRARVNAAESLRGELAALPSALADILQDQRVAAQQY